MTKMKSGDRFKRPHRHTMPDYQATGEQLPNDRGNIQLRIDLHRIIALSEGRLIERRTDRAESTVATNYAPPSFHTKRNWTDVPSEISREEAEALVPMCEQQLTILSSTEKEVDPRAANLQAAVMPMIMANAYEMTPSLTR